MKGEVLMILNHRPQNRAVLCTLIEEYEERFTETQLDELVDLVKSSTGPVADPEEVQLIQARINADRHAESGKPAEQKPVQDNNLTRSKGKNISATDSNPEMQGSAPIDELADLEALMEKEAEENQEHLDHVDDSPLTTYVKSLRISNPQ